MSYRTFDNICNTNMNLAKNSSRIFIQKKNEDLSPITSLWWNTHYWRPWKKTMEKWVNKIADGSSGNQIPIPDFIGLANWENDMDMSIWQSKFNNTKYGSVFYASSEKFIPKNINGKLIKINQLFHETSDGLILEGDSKTKYKIPIQILYDSSRWINLKSASIAIYDRSQKNGVVTSSRTITGASFKERNTNITVNVFVSNLPHFDFGSPNYNDSRESQVNGWYNKIMNIIGKNPDKILYMSDTNLYVLDDNDNENPLKNIPSEINLSASTHPFLKNTKTCCTGENPRWSHYYDIIAYSGMNVSYVSGGYALTKEIMNDDKNLKGDHPHIPIYLTIR